MTHQLKMTIALRSISGLAIGTGSGEGAVIDNSIMRNSQGLPYIPGSQVKGALRARVTQLCNTLQLDHEIIQHLFGNEYQAGSLRFAHLNAVISPNVSDFTTHIRTLVTINRYRRIAENGLLRTIEVADDGIEYAHTNAITGVIKEPFYASLLYAAIHLNTTWGHSKSRGLGWMEPSQIIVLIDGHQYSHDDLIDALGSLNASSTTGNDQDG